MGKLSLSGMKARSKDHFFSPSTRKFFRGSRNKAFYDKKTGRNFIRVTSPSGRSSWYAFRKDGKTDYIPQDRLPKGIRDRLKRR